MSKHLSSRDRRIREVFNRTLPFIDSALISQYRLPKADALEVEQGLREWFNRFSRRPGSPDSAEALRPQLLLMTCHAGHVYWIAQLGPANAHDEVVNRTLTLGPREIAIELEKRIEEKGPIEGRDPREDIGRDNEEKDPREG